MVELDKMESKAFEQLISDEEFERILNLIPNGESVGIETSELSAGTGIAFKIMKGWEEYEKEISRLQVKDMEDGKNRVGALTFRMFKKLNPLPRAPKPQGEALRG